MGDTQIPDEGCGNGAGQEKFCAVDRADHLARLCALQQQVGCDNRAPAAAARRIQKAADQPQRRNDFRVFDMGIMVQPAPQEPEADRREIGEDKGFDESRVEARQHISAQHAADYARHHQPQE